MGTRSTQPAPQEGTQAPHRQAADQIRRRLRAGAASDFRARPVSPDASISRKRFKRGGEFARRTSRSACSRPLSRIRGSGSSCHVTSRPPSTATVSSGGFASSHGLVCCRRYAPVLRKISRFEPSATPTPREWMPWRPISPRSLAEFRRSRAPIPRTTRLRTHKSNAAPSGLVRARLPGGDLADTAGVVPLLSKLLGVRDRSNRTLRRGARRVDGGEANRPVSSVPSGRLRPRPIANRLSGTQHG
jgi:hypothetical protein